MEITRTTDYAIRAVLYLARKGSEKPVPAAEIAREQEIPAVYVSKVLQALTRARLVATRPGRSGGAMLQRAPEEVSLLDIIQAVEGPIYLNRGLVRSQECSRERHCPLHPYWKDLRKELTDRLRRATIDQFAKRDTPAAVAAAVGEEEATP